MSKVKHQKRIIKKYLAFVLLLFLIPSYSHVWSADPVAETFTSQTSSLAGSSNSLVGVDQNLSYINKGNNSSILGNYFVGYYHDSMWGYFKTDWSATANQNVRVVGSASLCSNGYGYKLGGYAYNQYFGFVDFDYDKNTFVYYCESDASLHGFAYNSDLGLQSFEGITFDIEVNATTVSDTPQSNNAFVNDNSSIISNNQPSSSATTSTSSTSSGPAGSSTSGSGGAPVRGSGGGATQIGGDIIEFEPVQETLFYIIK